jgi:phage baseplate assembly protein W
MARDLAIDYRTGDLLMSPTGDVDQRTGVGTIDQRIRVQLRVIEGHWWINPGLGSRIHELLVMPMPFALGEAELAIREALLKIPDIRVERVDVGQSEDSSSTLTVGIYYVLTEDEGEEQIVFNTTLGAQ